MEINQSHFLNEPKKEQTTKNKTKSKKNNTGLIVLFILIFAFIGMIYFILNLSEENKANIDTNKQEKQIDKENNTTNSYIPPMPIIETEDNTEKNNTTNEDKNIFDFQAIENKKNEPVITNKEVIVSQEINNNDKQINTEKQNLNKVKNENNATDNNFELIKKEANIKTNFFKFRDKNFYEGDTIMNFKILEVTNFKITLQNKNNELKEIYK